MTMRDDLDRVPPEFDRLLSGWFEVEARVHAPSDLLGRTTARTRTIRPRPTWLLPERWIPMELTMRRVRTPLFFRYAAVVAVIVLVAAIALVVVGSQRRVPAPFGPARNGVITYATPAGDIATVDPATGITRLIVNGPEADRAPAFSRDGTRVAFIRKITIPAEGLSPPVPGGDAIYAVDVSGGNLIRLTNGHLVAVSGVVWAPDASSIAVVADEGLQIAKADGSGTRRVDMGDIVPTVELAWLPPDGGALLVAGRQEGKTRLFMTTPSGSDLHRVGQFDGGADDFQWLTASADGRFAAYGAYPDRQIHVVSIDTGLDRVVTPDDGVGLNFPRFSPDGRQLAVLQVPAGDTSTTRIGVFAVDHLSPHLTLLEPAFKGGVQFDWSPDGKSIVANQWDSDEIWLLDPAGGPGIKTTTRATFDWVEWQRLAD